MSYSSPVHSSPLQILVEEIKFQQQKEHQLQQSNLTKDVIGFMSRGTTFWTDIFVRNFLFQTDRSKSGTEDDLLFFVRKKHVRGNLALPKFQTNVEVFRKDSKKLPIGDPEIEWEETVYLNLLIHHLDYTLTLAICCRTSAKDLQVLKRHSQKVYASPSRRRMDSAKAEVEEITYPYLSFMIDNFDEVFNEIVVRESEMVCVELLAVDRDQAFQAVLFLGSIRYDALKRVYDSRASVSSKMAQRITFGLFSGFQQRVEYVRLKGPYGKGHAEVAVSKLKGAGSETPTSEPGFSMTDGFSWDSDHESDHEESIQRHHRRLSDPSASFNNFTRSSGWMSFKGGSGNKGGDSYAKKTRSQAEGLDYCGTDIAEIEAGDVRDVADDLWCCGCCDRECGLNNRSRNVSGGCDSIEEDPSVPGPSSKGRSRQRTESSGDSSVGSGCYCCCSPATSFTRSQSMALDSINPPPPEPITPTATRQAKPFKKKRLKSIRKQQNKEAREEAIKMNRREKFVHQRSVRSLPGITTSMSLNDSPRPPFLRGKTLASGASPPSISSRLITNFTLRKSLSIACITDARLILKEKLRQTIPNRVTSNGVRVFYICDYKTEIGDGVYNPIWTLRGCTTSFANWRESRRAQSIPLNTFLTYITLPCSSIMKDILETREDPVLTF